MNNIDFITKELNIPEEYIYNYGKDIAKINYRYLNKLQSKDDGKLILVTATNPTPFGEGKTTVSIGLCDAINKLNKKAILSLREPSVGPVFGMKGTATGGGKAVLFPEEEINLHFTGDLHAITSANNLIAAVLDNMIFNKELEVKEVVFKRTLDVNDRQLREIITGLKKKSNGDVLESGFIITAATEIMAILCLATDFEDLRRRISKIIVAYDKNEKPIYVKDLKIVDSVLLLLKNALNPNLVRTIENSPAFVHGGPFANIAHGCSSILATKLALKMSDYTITEAGFGADLGAEKFINIKSRLNNLKINTVVVVTTIRSIKYNANVNIENIEKENLDAIRKGIVNVQRHISNLENFGLNVYVAINKFNTDTEKELELVKKLLSNSEIVDVFDKGGSGAIDLAKKILENDIVIDNKINYCYELEDSLMDKINAVVTKIYRADGIIVDEEIKEKILNIDNNYPICIAKTPYSFSDNKNLLGAPTNFKFNIKDVIISNGAEFNIVIAGNTIRMPGLPKYPNANNIKIKEVEDGYIVEGMK